MTDVLVEVHLDHHTLVVLLQRGLVADRKRLHCIRIRYLDEASSCSPPVGDRRNPRLGINCNTTEVDGID